MALLLHETSAEANAKLVVRVNELAQRVVYSGPVTDRCRRIRLKIARLLPKGCPREARGGRVRGSKLTMREKND